MLFKRFRNLFIALAACCFLVVSFSCTPHPNEQQINAMEETIDATLEAERKLEELKQQRGQLEGELSQKNSKVDGVKKDKADTEKRLEGWEEN